MGMEKFWQYPHREWVEAKYGSSFFSLYTCLVVEQWLARSDGAQQVAITVKYKYVGGGAPGMLARRTLINACLQMWGLPDFNKIGCREGSTGI